MKVYFISGLGADCRVFKNIQLPHTHEAVHLEWIRPEKRESLREYSSRLCERIDPGEKFALVGLSMGGMIAVEIANRLHPFKTILISSVPSSHELPFYYRIGGKLYMHKFMPIALVKNASILKRLFTTETSEDKTLLRQIIRESDPFFIRWAMGAIVKWKNETVPPNLVHIHGTRDELLPMRFTKPTHVIPKAGHLMVMARADEINDILGSVLREGERE